MSSSYGQLQMKFNTLLQLQLDNQGGSSATQTLQQVLTTDNVATIPIILGNTVLNSTLDNISLTITDTVSRLTKFDENGLYVQNSSGISRFESYYLEFTSGMGLFTDAATSSLQLLNPIGTVDISGVTVSIMGVEYRPTFSGTNVIIPFFSTGRIIFSASPLSYIPSVSISQVSTSDIVGLCITDITNFDFGFKATNVGIGSISWTAR